MRGSRVALLPLGVWWWSRAAVRPVREPGGAAAASEPGGRRRRRVHALHRSTLRTEAAIGVEDLTAGTTFGQVLGAAACPVREPGGVAAASEPGRRRRQRVHALHQRTSHRTRAIADDQ